MVHYSTCILCNLQSVDFKQNCGDDDFFPLMNLVLTDRL
jgi:hypothetical protein